MSRGKMVYVSEEVHRQLRLLAAQQDRSMGELVGELVEQEMAEVVNPWTSRGGLTLQQKALGDLWDDPALDVYNLD